jgi:hypothetical protein
MHRLDGRLVDRVLSELGEAPLGGKLGAPLPFGDRHGRLARA